MFERAIKLDPKSHFAYHCLADLFFSNGLLREAKKTYEYSIKMADDCAIAYLQLGRVNLKLDEPVRAISAFDAALQLDPKEEDAFFEKAIALHSLGKFKEALIAISRAIKLKSDPIFFGLLGQILTDKGEASKAEVAFKKAMKYLHDNHKLYHEYAKLLILQKKYRSAVQFFEKSIKIDKTCSAAFSDLGLAYLHLNSVDKAINHFLTALKIDGNLLNVYYYLGLAFLVKGNKQEASKWYSKAVTKDKDKKLLREALNDFKHFNIADNTVQPYIKYLKNKLKQYRENRIKP